jgi:hypothetical protein
MEHGAAVAIPKQIGHSIAFAIVDARLQKYDRSRAVL